MCRAGRFVAGFRAGTVEAPRVPGIVTRSLTQTVEGEWVVWAHKLARPAGDWFMPLSGGDLYPTDAVAQCRNGGRHDAPQRDCTCGFYAVSHPLDAEIAPGVVGLQVVLSGRILAFECPWSPVPTRGMAVIGMVSVNGRTMTFGNGPEPDDDWPDDALLFRAERQAVVRIDAPSTPPPPPNDPGGHLAALAARRPRGAGPVRLSLPASAPAVVPVDDDAGYCLLGVAQAELRRTALTPSAIPMPSTTAAAVAP
jgi:hypothetical protein